MENSIETIWKEGFLKNDALVAPKLNDLYNQKSLHLIDQLKRMFKINLMAILAFAIAVLSGWSSLANNNGNTWKALTPAPTVTTT